MSMPNDELGQETTTQTEAAAQVDGYKDAESFAQLEQKYTEEQQKAEEYLDLLRRTQADFINYRRRSTQEMGDVRTNAQANIIEQLLPVLDDLGRALSATPQELTNHPWVQGIRLVTKRLMGTLEQLGVRLVGKPGEQFDPRWHEALSMETRADVPEGTVLIVTRPGYALGEKVIRPAQVVVSRATSPANSQ
jgi:molecular chaperone GrpE